LLKDGDLDVACINRLRETSIVVAESTLHIYRELLEGNQVKGNPSAYLMRMLRNRSAPPPVCLSPFPPFHRGSDMRLPSTTSFTQKR